MTLRPARWPWVAFAGFLALASTGTVLELANHGPFWEDAGFLVAFTMFGLVGALIASRDLGNRIGILFLWGCGLAATSFVSSELVTATYEGGTRRGLGVAVAALIGDAGWLIGILPVMVLLPLLFPDGHVPSPRWRLLVWASLGTLVVVFAATMLGSRTLTGSIETAVVENPFFVPALAPVERALEGIFVLYLSFVAAAVTAMVLRFRRSRGVERQQLKWFAFAVVFFLAELILSEVLLAMGIQNGFFDTFLVAVSFLTLPVAVGVAVLRYHLYDLGVVVRKTLLYGLLVALATAVYVVVVVGLGTLVGRESSFLTVAAAVIVAVGFQPARARLTRLANRVVYGKRATPYEVLSEFSERVGETYAADDILPRMARVVAEGVNAERAEVWLKIGDELRMRAIWPAGDGHGSTRLPLPNGAMPQIDGADAAYPVEHRGELLGALAVAKSAAEPLSPSDAKLVEDLASQAGLVLGNVRLTEELRVRLDDLKAAQKRIVAAQDEARRRLERDIHDGAQQQLVALAVQARLARTMAERDPAKAGSLIERVEAGAHDALENLRDLARGIYPPLLADKGLAVALVGQARKALIPVTVESDVGRYPQEVEATVYFCALEALQNVTKHANATRASVRLEQANGQLTFTVSDDGGGFDPTSTGYGTGLQGMADRLDAVGGSFDVASSPGEGTTIAGRVPVAPA